MTTKIASSATTAPAKSEEAKAIPLVGLSGDDAQDGGQMRLL